MPAWQIGCFIVGLGTPIAILMLWAFGLLISARKLPEGKTSPEEDKEWPDEEGFRRLR